MATVAVRQVQLTAALGTLAAASAGGDRFEPGPGVGVLVHNTSVGSVTATVATPNTGPGGTAIDNFPITVAAGAIELRGPFDRPDWAGTAGLADIAWSASAGVLWAPVHI